VNGVFFIQKQKTKLEHWLSLVLSFLLLNQALINALESGQTKKIKLNEKTRKKRLSYGYKYF